MVKKQVLREYIHCAWKSAQGYLDSRFYKHKKCNKNLWLISERGNDARDNGYYFFKYLCEKHPELNTAYIIKRDSVDYGKVKNIGRIVEYGSKEHYYLLFIAEKLISSHIMGFTPCPGFFVGMDKRIKLFKGKKIFLQHGIIKDNIEGLKYPNTDVDVFICGAKAEYDFILKNYNYPPDTVCYTGLARYDNLSEFTTKKQILFMPTWRKWINAYSIEAFKKTEYFLACQSLLKNELLNDLLESYGYKLVFYPHYEIQKFISAFTGNKNVIIAKFEEYDVPELLKESEILITDYSSVYFDFAYMKKPIIYYQFDKEKFFLNHYQKGYFEEKMFGPVVEIEQDIVNIIQLILNKSFDEQKYLRNINCFFEYYDTHNCDRILKAILEKSGRDNETKK